MMFQPYDDDVVGIDANPDLLHVRIEDGQLWLSDDARQDIEICAGQCPNTSNPRLMLEFLRSACLRLQLVDMESEEAEGAFMSFCVLKGLEHAIDTHWQGADAVGAFRPEQLLHVFTTSFHPQVSMTLH